jgi:hypothetical protein
MQPIGTQAFEMWKAWYETNQDLLIGAIQQIRMILAEILQYTSSLAKCVRPLIDRLKSNVNAILFEDISAMSTSCCIHNSSGEFVMT